MQAVSQNKIDDLIGGSGFSLPKELQEDLLRLADEKKARFTSEGMSDEDAWIATIRLFHREDYWGFRQKSIAQRRINQKQLTPEKEMFQFVRTFFVPTFVTKVALFYFGIHYSKYPGEGYGYGVLAAALATVLNLSYFAFIKERRKAKLASEESFPEKREQ